MFRSAGVRAIIEIRAVLAIPVVLRRRHDGDESHRLRNVNVRKIEEDDVVDVIANLAG